MFKKFFNWGLGRIEAFYLRGILISLEYVVRGRDQERIPEVELILRNGIILKGEIQNETFERRVVSIRIEKNGKFYGTFVSVSIWQIAAVKYQIGEEGFPYDPENC